MINKGRLEFEKVLDRKINTELISLKFLQRQMFICGLKRCLNNMIWSSEMKKLDQNSVKKK